MNQSTLQEPPVQLRLYIMGGAPNATQVLANLEAVRQSLPPGRLQVEVIDIAADPHQPLADAILVTPTLVKLAPSPTAQILGNFSRTATVLQALGLSAGEKQAAASYMQPERAAQIQELVARLVETEEALQALSAGQVDTVLTPKERNIILLRGAQAYLQESEARYRALFELESDAVFLIDSGSGEIIEANCAATQLYGYSHAALLALRNTDLSAQPDETRRATQEKSINIPTRWHRKQDGTVFPVEITANHIVWRGRSCHIAAIRDITERHRIEAALQASEARFRVLFETLLTGVTVADEAGQIIAANPVAERILGLTSSEQAERVIDDAKWSIIRPDGSLMPAEEYASVRALKEQRSIHQVEMGVTRPAGGTAWISVNAAPLSAHGVVITYEDITARKQVEDALSVSERRYRDLFEHASLAVFQSTREGGIIAVNPAFARMFGYQSPEECKRAVHNAADFFADPQRREEVARLRIQNPDLSKFENVYRRKDGSTFVGQLTVNTFVDANGRVRHFDGFIEDITARKQAEDALRDLNAELERRVVERTKAVEAANQQLATANERLTELDRLKDEFLAHIGHELRTPLTSIKLYLELLAMARPEKRELYMNAVQREAELLQALIEDLLMVTQLSHAALEVRTEAVDLSTLIALRLPAWGNMAARKALKLTTHFAADLPPVWIDRDLTMQAITQLINNAINYTLAGSVTLATAIRSDEGRRWVTFSVTDTGPSIPPDEVPHLFERFYRGRVTANFKTPGAGVGLYISHEIAEKMQGRLTVATEPGAGSTFTLWLPTVPAGSEP